MIGQNESMPEPISAVILVAQVGRMPSSFRVLFKSVYPHLPIEQVDEISSLMTRMAAGAARLVLIDADLPDGAAWRLGETLQLALPHSAVILAHTVQQGEQARAAGLAALLLEGMTGANLTQAMTLRWQARRFPT